MCAGWLICSMLMVFSFTKLYSLLLLIFRFWFVVRMVDYMCRIFFFFFSSNLESGGMAHKFHMFVGIYFYFILSMVLLSAQHFKQPIVMDSKIFPNGLFNNNRFKKDKFQLKRRRRKMNGKTISLK